MYMEETIKEPQLMLSLCVMVYPLFACLMACFPSNLAIILKLAINLSKREELKDQVA